MPGGGGGGGGGSHGRESRRGLTLPQYFYNLSKLFTLTERKKIKRKRWKENRVSDAGVEAKANVAGGRASGVNSKKGHAFAATITRIVALAGLRWGVMGTNESYYCAPVHVIALTR